MTAKNIQNIFDSIVNELGIFHPLDFIARLVALVPKPRVNLTRFHGVFAPNSKQRALVTPAKRGKGKKANATDEPQMYAGAICALGLGNSFCMGF